MQETIKAEEAMIRSVLGMYGFGRSFGDRRVYIEAIDKYGYKVKLVLSVLTESGQRVVIKLVNTDGNDLDEDIKKIERQCAFSEFLRGHGIITPKYYSSDGKYCNVYEYNDIPCGVTVEDWCGEEITEINTDIAYMIGELMARMHIISYENKYKIGCGTLFSAAYKNDVDAYDDFCRICENENLNAEVVERIKSLHDEKKAAVRAVWDDLPKAAVQGDISINNLVYAENELTVFDYNNAGDEVLVSDLVLEGLLTAYEMDIPKDADGNYREAIFSSFLKGYLSVRRLTRAEADAAWIIYTLYNSLWFSRIIYSDTSLERLVNDGDHAAANALLSQMLADMVISDDGRFAAVG